MLGLGNSIGTPAEGISAEAVVVRNFAELDRLGERVRGKIVVYNVPFTTYGATVIYRLSRCFTSRSLWSGCSTSPFDNARQFANATHGSDAVRPNQPKIPVAAITIEAAELLQRMHDRGDRPRLKFKMEAKFLPDAESANVIAELKGTEKPDEIVLISGHYDSWDVGQGAHDDGGGCIVAWEAVRLLKELGLRPRRTIRVVLYTNEENGFARRQCISRRASSRDCETHPGDRIGFGSLSTGRFRTGRYSSATSEIEPPGDRKTAVGHRSRWYCSRRRRRRHWTNHA